MASDERILKEILRSQEDVFIGLPDVFNPPAPKEGEEMLALPGIYRVKVPRENTEKAGEAPREENKNKNNADNNAKEKAGSKEDGRATVTFAAPANDGGASTASQGKTSGCNCW